MRILFIMIIFFIVKGNSQTLEETVKIALDFNPAINAQKEAVNSAVNGAESAYLGSLPSLDFDASYRYQSEVAELSNQLPIPVEMPSTTIGAHHNYELGLIAQYALFTGFAEQSAINISRQKRYLNETILSKTEKDIAFNTILVYRTIQNLKLSIQTFTRARERVLLQLSRIKSLTRQGMALAIDTLSLALEVKNYDYEILSLNAELEKSGQTLKNLTGQNINVKQMTIEYIQTELAPYNPEGLETLKALEIRKTMTEQTRNIKSSNYYPKIGIFAGYKYGRPGVDIVNDDWIGWGVAGASLSWNLFRWGADKKAVEEQDAEISRINYQRQSVNDQAYLHYKNAVRDYQMLKEQLAVIEESLNLAQSKMKIIDIRYREGMETVTEFNDTNLDLAIKEIDQKRHLIMMMIKINELDYLSGKPLNNWSIIP